MSSKNNNQKMTMWDYSLLTINDAMCSCVHRRQFINHYSWGLQGFLDGDSSEILGDIFDLLQVVGTYKEKSICGEAVLDFSYCEDINGFQKGFCCKIFMTRERADKQVPMVNLPQFRGIKKSSQRESHEKKTPVYC